MENVSGRLAAVLVAGLMLGMTSCALGPDQGAARFQDEAFASLVIRYSTEQTIYRLKPDSREGVFMRIFDRETICAEAGAEPGPRHLAVVVVDYIYSPQTERELVDSWVESFRPLNFQRVVFLRNSGSESLNGKRIVADIQLSQYGLIPSASAGYAAR